MKYIIHGATEAQGLPLFNKLLQAGKAALAAVRDPATLTHAPAREQIQHKLMLFSIFLSSIVCLIFKAGNKRYLNDTLRSLYDSHFSCTILASLK